MRAPRTPRTGTPARRSQAERRSQTQRRLREATLACLVEVGHAGTTTALIEATAGVSRGARLHHFPTKAALLAAAVEAYYEQVMHAYTAALAAMGPAGRDFSAGFHLLWETYCDPQNAALFEILVAARTDPELGEALREVAGRRSGQTRRLARDLFPDLATPEAAGLLECLQASLLGLALQTTVFGKSRSEARARSLLEKMVTERFLEPASPAHA